MGLGMSTYSPPGGENGRRWILGEKFDAVAPHKGSIKLLWETKWRAAVCPIQVYRDNANELSARNPSTPFMMGNWRTLSRSSRLLLPYVFKGYQG